jgi:hypothetical protein
VSADPALAINSPSVAASATGAGALGGGVADEARLEGGNEETGTIEFALFGPGDPTCSGEPLDATAATVSGPGPYRSKYFPAKVGEYTWLVRYAGDANNAPASTTCGQPSQRFQMTAGRPTLVTTASNASGTLEDDALLSGGVPNSGSVVFRLFGPGDESCRGAPLFVATRPVVYQGHYASGPFTPSGPGTYRFQAEYSGDENDEPAIAPCGTGGQSLTLAGPSSPVLTQHATVSAFAGEQISDSIVLAGGSDPTGTLVFRLYAPGDTSCSHGAIAVSTSAAAGDGVYTSTPFATVAPGEYRYTAAYSGDGLNGPAATACGSPGGVVSVSPVAPPALARTFTVTPVSGKVQVQTAAVGTGAARVASAGFVELHSPRTVPFGSTVDTLHGTAQIATATETARHTQSGIFTGSSFVVRQRRDKLGHTRLHLNDAPHALCGASAGATVAKRHHLSKRLLARLRAEASGHFTTEGKDSAASVRGTGWEVQDRCDGTLTHVFHGAVAVLEYRSRRTVVLRRGMSYLAPAR